MRYNSVTPIGITVDEATICEPKSCIQPEDDAWDIALSLPPTPDQGKCECLWQSLSCVIASDAQFDEEVALKDLCFKVDCEDINANGRLGKYGKYSDCNPTVRASYALNKHYEQSGRKQDICDFQGRGQLSSGRGLDDLGSKYSSDGRNCLAIIEGRAQPDCQPGQGGGKDNDGKEYDHGKVIMNMVRSMMMVTTTMTTMMMMMTMVVIMVMIARVAKIHLDHVENRIRNHIIKSKG